MKLILMQYLQQYKLKLYKNLGFVQISDIEEGFNGNNIEKPEVILMSLKIK